MAHEGMQRDAFLTARGLRDLERDSCLTAEPFYRALGYQVVGRGEHVLSSGRRMACAHMRKSLPA